MIDRREFLRACAALGLASSAAPAHAQKGATRFDAAPFALGVASGYPTQDGVVIWTRLIIDPTRGDGGIDPVRIRLNWEVASDEKFATVVAKDSNSSCRRGRIRRASK